MGTLPILQVNEQHKSYDIGFYCFACKSLHYVRIKGFFKRIDMSGYPSDIKILFRTEGYSEYTFNNNYNLPTIQEPIKILTPEGVCSFIVRKGRITYLSDSFHPLKNRGFNMQNV